MRHYILALFLMLSSVVLAQEKAADRTRHFNLEKGIAIQGYDPVAYFSSNALEGDEKYAINYMGVTYHFVSESNKSKFLKNPSKYEPQYGGWCAYAMGNSGEKVEIDPETFKIVDGKLYLFYNFYFNNTLKSWNKDEINLKGKADKNWLEIIRL